MSSLSLKDFLDEIKVDLLHQEVEKLAYYEMCLIRKAKGQKVAEDDPIVIEEILAGFLVSNFLATYNEALEEIEAGGYLRAALEASYTPGVTVLPDLTFLTPLFAKYFGMEWANANRDTISSALTTMYSRAAEAVTGGSYTPTMFDQDLIRQLSTLSVFWYSRGTEQQIITPVLEQILRYAIANELSIDQTLQLLSQNLRTLIPGRSEVYYNALSSIVVNETRNFARITMFANAGVTTVTWVGVDDEVQCSRCETLDGTTWHIETLMELMQNTLNASTPDAVIDSHPFPGWDRNEQAFVLSNGTRIAGNASEEELAQAGIGIPPLHSACRCYLEVA